MSPTRTPPIAFVYPRLPNILRFFFIFLLITACDEQKPQEPGTNTNTWSSGMGDMSGSQSCYQRNQSNCTPPCIWSNYTCSDNSSGMGSGSGQYCGSMDATTCESQQNCVLNPQTRICQDNPCSYYQPASVCNSNSSQCTWRTDRNTCVPRNMGGCEGKSAMECSTVGCAWTGTSCITQSTNCYGLDQYSCGNGTSQGCSWDPVNQTCLSNNNACAAATTIDQCRGLADCTWRNSCVSLAGACSGLDQLTCSRNLDCRWYATLNMCGSALGTNGAGSDPDKLMKLRMTMAAGLGALQGLFTGGGVGGALTGALNQLNAVFTGGVPPTGMNNGIFNGIGGQNLNNGYNNGYNYGYSNAFTNGYNNNYNNTYGYGNNNTYDTFNNNSMYGNNSNIYGNNLNNNTYSDNYNSNNYNNGYNNGYNNSNNYNNNNAYNSTYLNAPASEDDAAGKDKEINPRIIGGGLANSFAIRSPETTSTGLVACTSMRDESACGQAEDCQWDAGKKVCDKHP